MITRESKVNSEKDSHLCRTKTFRPKLQSWKVIFGEKLHFKLHYHVRELLDRRKLYSLSINANQIVLALKHRQCSSIKQHLRKAVSRSSLAINLHVVEARKFWHLNAFSEFDFSFRSNFQSTSFQLTRVTKHYAKWNSLASPPPRRAI